MRKTVFQVIVGASIAVCTVCLVVILAKSLSLRAYSAKIPRVYTAPARTTPLPPPEEWRNLFAPEAGMQLPSHLPAQTLSDVKHGVRSNFVLLGTIVSTLPGDSRAILWSDGMKLPKLVRVNTQVEPGAILASVTRDKAVINRGATQEQIDLLPVGSRSRSPSPSTVERSPSAIRAPDARQTTATEVSSDGALRVERADENNFILDEAGLAYLSGNINQFMANVRITPYFEGSASAGYRMASIPPGTAFDKLGFRSGDIIQNVNGVTLSSPEKMYTIFQNLKDEKTVSVDIIRQGKKNTLKYDIK